MAQIRVGKVTLRNSEQQAQIRIGRVTLSSASGAQIRVGKATLSTLVGPTVTLGLSAATGNQPLPVTATVTATDPQGLALGYTVDYGDGTPPALTAVSSHTYTTVGVFTVTATASNSAGLAGTAAATVTVTGSQQRRIFAVMVGGVPKPVVLRGIITGGQLQPLQFDGLLAAGVLVDPNAKI